MKSSGITITSGAPPPPLMATTWTRPSVTGSAPSARCAHTTVTSGNKLIVFGGWNGARMLNDLHIFHPDSMTWSRPIATNDAPGCRAGHSCVALGTKLYVFGGGDGNLYLNDLHILDTETMAWSQAYVAGTSPAARSRHTATAIGNKLVVIGGGDDARVYNDVYILDTATMAWSKIQPQGVPPAARWGHVSCSVGNRLYLHGGHDSQRMLNDLWCLDCDTMSWSLISYTGAFSPRAGHTCTAVGGKLFFFGGGDGNRILNDLWVFDPETRTMTQPQVIGTAPAARCAHTTTLWEGKLLVFGGGDGNRRFKDLYLLDADALLKAKVAAKLQQQQQQLKKHDSSGSFDAKAIKNGHASATTAAEEYKDVPSWLNAIGMKKYADRFAREEIDMSTLPLLTEVHLERMGISTIGARLQIMNAIAALRKPSVQEQLLHTLNHNVLMLAAASNQLATLLGGVPVVVSAPTTPVRSRDSSPASAAYGGITRNSELRRSAADYSNGSSSSNTPLQQPRDSRRSITGDPTTPAVSAAGQPLPQQSSVVQTPAQGQHPQQSSAAHVSSSQPHQQISQQIVSPQPHPSPSVVSQQHSAAVYSAMNGAPVPPPPPNATHEHKEPRKHDPTHMFFPS